jgi:hypothetical protein
VTVGAAMGHLDLALWLIRQASPELSAIVSRYLLADIRSTQAAYIIPNHLAKADPLILRFERWAREHLKEGFSLEGAAEALATSARTLQRRCSEVQENRHWPISRTCASNMPNHDCTALASTSMPLRRRSATSTAQRRERSCASGWVLAYVSFEPNCADGATRT